MVPTATIEDEGQSGAELPSYFTNNRPDLLRLTPPTASRVLEIGCGAGQLGAAIKERQSAHVVGIDLNPTAVTIASTKLDQAFTADLDTYEFPFPDRSFDCIVAGDILEHLKDPWRALRHCARLLGKDGILITSIPNACNVEVLYQLSGGLFNYVDAGILDRTHLRFFTRVSFLEALLTTGFALINLEPIMSPLYSELPEEIRQNGGSIGIGDITINTRNSVHLRDLLAYQWLYVARPF